MIYLSVPYTCKRDGKAYTLPAFLNNPHITVLRTPIDYGPATKLYGALMKHQDENCNIIFVDDDMVYGRGMVEEFDRVSTMHPDSALAFSGYTIGEHGTVKGKLRIAAQYLLLTSLRRIDTLQGVHGVLVKPSFFDLPSLMRQDIPRYLWLEDDTWIARNLAARNVKLLQVPRSYTTIHYSNWLPGALSENENAGCVNCGKGIEYFKGKWLSQR